MLRVDGKVDNRRISDSCISKVFHIDLRVIVNLIFGDGDFFVIKGKFMILKRSFLCREGNKQVYV